MYFLNVPDCELSRYLETNFTTIKDEFVNEILPKVVSNKPNYLIQNGELLYQEKILITAFKLHPSLLDRFELAIVSKRWPLHSDGHFYPYPERLKYDSVFNYIKDLPYVRQGFIDTLFPNASIARHLGVSSDCYRLHLTLTENPEFVFEVEGHFKSWQTGDMFMFDDGNLQHSVVNNGLSNGETRSVLILDILKSHFV